MKKKSFLIVAVLLIFSLLTFAQKAFQNGDNFINAGIGVAGIVWKGVTYGASYERGISDNIGAGGHLGYSQYSKNGYKYTAIIVGVKGSYHFLTTDKSDPYAGAELGYISISHSGSNESRPAHYSPVGVGLYGGIRYYLSPGIGVYGELHISTFAIIGLGVCFKL